MISEGEHCGQTLYLVNMNCRRLYEIVLNKRGFLDR